MKFNFFSRPVVLDSLESETLKVALLDALKYTHDQREMLDVDSKEMPAIVNKVTRLNALIKKLEGDCKIFCVNPKIGQITQEYLHERRNRKTIR